MGWVGIKDNLLNFDMKKVNLWSDDSSIYKKIYLGQIFLKIAEWSDFLIADQYFQPRSRRFYTSTFGLEKPSISRKLSLAGSKEHFK